MGSSVPFALPQRLAAPLARRIAVFAAVAGVLTFGASRPAAASNPFDVRVRILGVGDTVPATPFTDQTGKPIRLQDFGNRTVVLAFIYTSCTDECPLISAKFAQLQRILDPAKFHLVEVTLDPARDTPQKVRAYAHRFKVDPSMWSILIADQSRLATFWRAMGESVIAGTHGEIIHNDRTVVVGPDSRIADIIDEATWTAAQMAAQAQEVAGQPSSALARADLALGKAVAFVCGGFQSGHAGIVDVIAMIAVTVVFGLALYLIGRRIFALSD